MKYLNHLALTILSVSLLSCSNSKIFTISKISVQPDKLYLQEASGLIGKKVTAVIHSESLELIIDEQEAVLLKLSGNNHNYEKTQNNMDYDMTYTGFHNEINYTLHILKDRAGNSLLKIGITKPNKSPDMPIIPGDGTDAAIMNSFRKVVIISITATY